MNEVWVLGATGRTGRAIARKLTTRGIEPVVVARDPARVEALARELGARAVVAASVPEMAAAIRRERPGVVLNTVGPYQRTARGLAEAALGAGSYLDLANDVGTIREHRGRGEAARRSGHTLVTGAGFGVTATESILTKLMEGQPAAMRVRVDMIPSLAMEEGRLGEALAGSLVDGLPGVPGGGRFRGRRVVNGELAPVAIGGCLLPLTTPDGDEVTTALMPLGELLAAERASGASFVEAASSEAPSGIVRHSIRAIFPLLHIAALRRCATRRLAAVTTSGRPAPRAHSWAHARLEWSDESVREGWLRAGDASDFTASVAAEAATRLADGRGRPGTYTPAELFGSELAEASGGDYMLSPGPPA